MIDNEGSKDKDLQENCGVSLTEVAGSAGSGFSSLLVEFDDDMENDDEIKSFNVTIGARICCVNVKSFLFFFVGVNIADKQHDLALLCFRFFRRRFFCIYPLVLVRLNCEERFSMVNVPLN